MSELGLDDDLLHCAFDIVIKTFPWCNPYGARVTEDMGICHRDQSRRN